MQVKCTWNLGGFVHGSIVFCMCSWIISSWWKRWHFYHMFSVTVHLLAQTLWKKCLATHAIKRRYSKDEQMDKGPEVSPHLPLSLRKALDVVCTMPRRYFKIHAVVFPCFNFAIPSLHYLFFLHSKYLMWFHRNSEILRVNKSHILGSC